MVAQNILRPTRSVLAEILRDRYDLVLRSFEIPPKGTKNTTAIVRTDKGLFVLRVYAKHGRSDAQIMGELDFISYLRGHGIPTPHVFLNTRGELVSKHKKGNTMWRCILMEFLPGAHPKRYTKDRLRFLAEAHARMHKLGIAYAERRPHRGARITVLRDDFFSPRLDLNKIKSVAVKGFLERGRRFSVSLGNRLPQGYNQLDYARGNMLLKGGKLTGVLDFDDLTYTPTVICLGYTVWNALYASYENKKLKGTAWGLSDGQAKIFTGVAIIIGGLIVAFTSFMMLFIVMGIVQLAASFYLLRILRM